MSIAHETHALYLAPAEGEIVRVLGDPITFKVRARQSGGFTLFEGLVARGVAGPIHFHHREEETFYVLEGVITFLLGDEWREAPAGTVVHVPRGTVHGFKNTGSSDARLLTLVTPGELIEELFAALSQLPPPASPEDGAAIVQLARRYGTEILPPPPE